MTHEESQSSIPEGGGRGLCYPLALFIAHEGALNQVRAEIETMAAAGGILFDSGAERDTRSRQKTLDRLTAIRWFSRAGGPIAVLEIPHRIPKPLSERLAEFRERCHKWSWPESTLSGPNEADVGWAIEEAKELIRLIDEHHGIPTVRQLELPGQTGEPFLTIRDD